MRISQRILRFFHPHAENEREQMREILSRARAEAEDLNRTLRDFPSSNSTVSVMNGVKRVIKFSTFADTCSYATTGDFAVRFCRHPEHECKGKIAKCDVEVCPIMIKALE